MHGDEIYQGEDILSFWNLCPILLAFVNKICSTQIYQMYTRYSHCKTEVKFMHFKKMFLCPVDLKKFALRRDKNHHHKNPYSRKLICLPLWDITYME